MTAFDDADAERAAERVESRLRERVGSLPLRAAYVEALSIEALPAIHALIFAISTDRAEDATALEHHESMAMVALLGRSLALEGATPTAAYGVVPALLESLRDEGFAVPRSLDEPLRAVFLEGYVRGRDEKLRAELAARAIDQVVLLDLGEGIGLVVVRGEHESEALTDRLERLARDAFGGELSTVILDVAGGELALESVAGPVLNFAATVGSLGVRVLFVGPAAEAWATTVRAETAATVSDALISSRRRGGLAGRAERSLVVPLRAWLRSRAERQS